MWNSPCQRGTSMSRCWKGSMPGIRVSMISTLLVEEGWSRVNA